MSKRRKFREQDELEELEQDKLKILAKRPRKTSQRDEEEQDPVEAAFDTFFADGLIDEILYTVKSGKEATVYCCRACPSMNVELLGAKYYRSRNNRGFKNDAVYQEGRVILDGHARRAVQGKTDFGREAQFAMWVNHEYGVLQALHKAGADTPRPVAQTSSAILMEYFGDQQEAAPALQFVELSSGEARTIFDQLLYNIELWLVHNYIHADLSAYNILYWQGKARIIDFPQAVDPRFNPNALALLTRDITNVCQYFTHYGLKYDGQRIAERLWRKFRNAEL